jgi:hypothetical protein
MAAHDTADQRSAITRFWFASLMFWPAVFVAWMASGSWLIGVIAGVGLTLATIAVTWRLTFGDWSCLSAGRKGGRG